MRIPQGSGLTNMQWDEADMLQVCSQLVMQIMTAPAYIHLHSHICTMDTGCYLSCHLQVSAMRLCKVDCFKLQPLVLHDSIMSHFT